MSNDTQNFGEGVPPETLKVAGFEPYRAAGDPLPGEVRTDEGIGGDGPRNKELWVSGNRTPARTRREWCLQYRSDNSVPRHREIWWQNVVRFYGLTKCEVPAETAAPEAAKEQLFVSSFRPGLEPNPLSFYVDLYREMTGDDEPTHAFAYFRLSKVEQVMNVTPVPFERTSETEATPATAAEKISWEHQPSGALQVKCTVARDEPGIQVTKLGQRLFSRTVNPQNQDEKDVPFHGVIAVIIRRDASTGKAVLALDQTGPMKDADYMEVALGLRGMAIDAPVPPPVAPVTGQEPKPYRIRLPAGLPTPVEPGPAVERAVEKLGAEITGQITRVGIGEGSEASGVMAEIPPSLRQRIIRKIFPRRWCESPDWMAHPNGQAAPQREYISNTTWIEASILDRLRFLITGRALLEIRIAGEHEIGRTVTTSAFSVMPPAFLEDLA